MLPRVSRLLLPPLIVLAALLAFRLARSLVGPVWIEPRRNEPLVIAPRYDDPRVVTDEQLAAVLDRVKPPPGPVKTNNLVHALRLWGAAADFHDPAIPTGRQMRGYLLDDRVLRQMAGDQTPPLMYRDGASRGRGRITVRSYDDRPDHRDTSSYHADDLLATLAETLTPLDAPLHMRDGQATVGELLDDSLGRFHLDRLEYEWATIAYARYVFPQPSLRNQWGERITVDQLVDEAIGPALELGPCNGLHRLEALVVLYRADEQCAGLPARTKAKILAHLRRVAGLLTEAQTGEGFWTRQWPSGADAARSDASNVSVYDRILVTGHHLEWLALAPEEVQPPRETVVRAGQWLTRTLLELDERDIAEAYGPYTHAARALALWRSQEPYAAWKGQHLPAARPEAPIAVLE